MIASFLALTRMKDHSRLREFSDRPATAKRACALRAEKALTLCRLQESSNKPAAELSYGEEKMLGVAMAMMCEPELLLLDEPASGLGNDEIQNLENVLRDLRAHGTTLCIIDHKVAFLAKFADQAIALQQGCKIAARPSARRAGRSRRGESLSGTQPSCLSCQPSTRITARTRWCASIDLKVAAGEVVALIGANAAGKSTTMRLIAGLKRATSGSIRLDGVEIEPLSTPKRVRLGIALVPEGRQVFAQSTVLENLTMGAYHRADRNHIQHDIDAMFAMFPQAWASAATSAPARCRAASSRWWRSPGD